jgi:hypothetical protein
MTTLEFILGLLSIGLGGGLISEIYKRKNPTALEKVQLKTGNAGFIKAHTEAQLAHIELTHELQKMVDEKTAHIEEILVRRELEHSQQMESMIKKLAEETARAEDYWEQLKDAKKQVAYWRTQYDDLIKKYEN